jgi:hypothetical protein
MSPTKKGKFHVQEANVHITEGNSCTGPAVAECSQRNKFNGNAKAKYAPQGNVRTMQCNTNTASNLVRLPH